MNNFERALQHIFTVEGGYSDHPEDKGGKTKYGITERTYEDRLKRNTWARPGSIHELTKAEARSIYRQGYWNKIRGDDLPRGVSLMVFDSAVHAGPTRAIKWLQRAVGEKADGLFGPKTLLAANRTNRGSSIHEPLTIIREIATYRLLMARKNDTFAKGWFRRITFILAASIEEVYIRLTFIPKEVSEGSGNGGS